MRRKGQGCNIDELGEGYDETDDFIDNSEAVSYIKSLYSLYISYIIL